MTFLPIVERELRVAARRRGTHWSRLLIALMAMLLGVVIFLESRNSPAQMMGEVIFGWLTFLCMVHCVLVGRTSTADCLSEEKREGTLGLLFLTDLKGYDIVLGKLVSTSLGAFYGLMAVMPVLAVPLLMGGVSNGQFWRVVLALILSFLFSLSIGMFASSVSREVRQAMGLNLGIAILLMAALPLGLMFLVDQYSRVQSPFVMATSPFFLAWAAFDFDYQREPGMYWGSLGIIAGLTLLFLLLACWLVPRNWQDKALEPPKGRKFTWRGFWRSLSYGPREKLAAYRAQLLNVNAYYWLAARARLRPHQVWAFLVVAAGWWLFGRWKVGRDWLFPAVSIAFAVLVNTTLKGWIAIEAGQQLAEDRRAGSLELLLATPLTVREILRGQFLALRRQFLEPMLVALLAEMLLMLSSLQQVDQHDARQLIWFWLAGFAALAADVLTLPLVAMYHAMTAKSQVVATRNSILLILVVPWGLFGLICAGISVFVDYLNNGWWTGWADFGPILFLSIWFGISISIDYFFARRSWRRLNGRFRELAAKRFAPSPSRLSSLFRKKQQPAEAAG